MNRINNSIEVTSTKLIIITNHGLNCSKTVCKSLEGYGYIYIYKIINIVKV